MPQACRKITWVFGSGASRGAGATVKVQKGGLLQIPTQSDFWPTILKYAKSNEQIIQSFLFR